MKNNMTSDKELNDFYLDYVNNYITVSKMAEDYNLSVRDTLALINKGKEIHKSLEIGTLKDEVYMLADEARQMSELLKRLDKIGTIDLEFECLGFVKDTEYGVGIPESYYGAV